MAYPKETAQVPRGPYMLELYQSMLPQPEVLGWCKEYAVAWRGEVYSRCKG